jgi:hypothetical protein
MSSPETQTRNAKQDGRPPTDHLRRPPTPFHRTFPLPDEDDQLLEGQMSGNSVSASRLQACHPGPTASDSGTTVQPAVSTSENGQTIFLDADDRDAPKSRNSITSGASFHQSSAGEEYSFPDPFVAKVALKTLRKLNTTRRSVDGHGSAGDIGSACTGEEEEDQHGYGTDSSQRKQQRQIDNATVIPPTSSESMRKRSRPLHRELSAGKLWSALRGASTPVPAVSSGDANQLGSLEGPEIDVSLTNDALRHRKPLPPPPPFNQPDIDHTSGGGPSSGFGWPGQNQSSSREPGRSAFSLRSLRQSLPAIGINLPSGKRLMAAGYTRPTDPPSYMGGHTSSASHGQLHRPPFNSLGGRQVQRGTTYIQSQHTPPISASVPVLEGFLPSTGKTPRHAQHESSKIHPADNLSLYLRLASLPKWDKWIDPDVKTSSRWHNRSNWGTGRARRNSKSQGSNNQYEIIASNQDSEDRPSGRKRTIERLVYSVIHSADHVAVQGQEHAPAPPSAPGLAGPSRDAGKETAPRYLRSWENRRRFLDAIENREFAIAF